MCRAGRCGEGVRSSHSQWPSGGGTGGHSACRCGGWGGIAFCCDMRRGWKGRRAAQRGGGPGRFGRPLTPAAAGGCWAGRVGVGAAPYGGSAADGCGVKCTAHMAPQRKRCVRGGRRSQGGRGGGTALPRRLRWRGIYVTHALTLCGAWRSDRNGAEGLRGVGGAGAGICSARRRRRGGERVGGGRRWERAAAPTPTL